MPSPQTTGGAGGASGPGGGAESGTWSGASGMAKTYRSKLSPSLVLASDDCDPGSGTTGLTGRSFWQPATQTVAASTRESVSPFIQLRQPHEEPPSSQSDFLGHTSARKRAAGSLPVKRGWRGVRKVTSNFVSCPSASWLESSPDVASALHASRPGHWFRDSPVPVTYYTATHTQVCFLVP